MTSTELERYQSLATVGNIEAIHRLVDHYLEVKDYEKAFLNANRFSYFKDKDGFRKIGYFYEHGFHVEKNIEKAMEFYQKAYVLGDYVAGYNLAILYIKENEYLEAVKYLALGVYNEHISSIKLLADIYFKGLGVYKNIDVALKLYLSLLSKGDLSIIDKIGQIYYQKEDYYNAIKFFEQGYKNNDLDSIYHLAVCHAKAKGTNLDLGKAISLYELGAKNGHKKCIKNLAIHYQNGIGVKQDKKRSEQLLKQINE